MNTLKYLMNEMIESKWYDKLHTVYYNIKYGLYNFWTFRKVIWNYRSWDWVYSLSFLQAAIREQGKNIQKNKHHTTYKETVRLCKDIDKVITRICNEEYIDYKALSKITERTTRKEGEHIIWSAKPAKGMSKKTWEKQKNKIYEDGLKAEQQDLELLGTLLKKIKYIWD